MLLGDFAFGFVGGVFDFGVEAFEEPFDEGFGVGLRVLELVGEGDVAGEVGEDDAPGEGVFPGAGADADVLALFGDPDAQDLKGSFVAGGGGRDVEVFVGCHRALRVWRGSFELESPASIKLNVLPVKDMRQVGKRAKI